MELIKLVVLTSLIQCQIVVEWTQKLTKLSMNAVIDTLSLLQMTVDFIDVWLDRFEDGPLIKCLFETGIIPEELQAACVGMAILIEGAHIEKLIY